MFLSIIDAKQEKHSSLSIAFPPKLQTFTVYCKCKTNHIYVFYYVSC